MRRLDHLQYENELWCARQITILCFYCMLLRLQFQRCQLWFQIQLFIAQSAMYACTLYMILEPSYYKFSLFFVRCALVVPCSPRPLYGLHMLKLFSNGFTSDLQNSVPIQSVANQVKSQCCTSCLLALPQSSLVSRFHANLQRFNPFMSPSLHNGICTFFHAISTHLPPSR